MSKRTIVITALACTTTIVSHSFGRSLYSLLLPAIEDDLGLSHADAGIPSSGIYVLYVVGVFAVVFAAPRLEPVTIMRIALASSLVGIVIAALATNLFALTIGVSLLGGSGAGIWMTAPVLATEYVSVERRGLVIGALTSSMGLSNIALGIGTRTLRARADNDLLWRPLWWIAFGFTATILAALVLYARFAKTDRVNTRGVNFSILRQIPKWKQVTLAYGLFGGTAAGFSAFVVAAVEEHGGVSRSSSALVFSLVGVCGMIMAPVAGAVSDRFGRPAVMRSALAAIVGASVMVASGVGWIVVVGAMLYGAGASSIPALIAAYVRDSLDDRAFSQALAMMTILFSMLAAIVPAAMGAIADSTASFAWPYLLLALLPAAAIMLLWTVRPASPEAVSARLAGDVLE